MVWGRTYKQIASVDTSKTYIRCCNGPKKLQILEGLLLWGDKFCRCNSPILVKRIELSGKKKWTSLQAESSNHTQLTNVQGFVGTLDDVGKDSWAIFVFACSVLFLEFEFIMSLSTSERIFDASVSFFFSLCPAQEGNWLILIGSVNLLYQRPILKAVGRRCFGRPYGRFLST